MSCNDWLAFSQHNDLIVYKIQKQIIHWMVRNLGQPAEIELKLYLASRYKIRPTDCYTSTGLLPLV